MNKSLAVFGYNTDTNHNRLDWERIGTKYNFNLEGNILGIFTDGERTYLLTEVTKSRGNNCTVGTVDVREVCVLDKKLLVSNNEIPMEAMDIAIQLNTKKAIEELKDAKDIRDTESFAGLENELLKQYAELAPRVIVCGVEKKSFKAYQKAAQTKRHLI